MSVILYIHMRDSNSEFHINTDQHAVPSTVNNSTLLSIIRDCKAILTSLLLTNRHLYALS